jgi:hypothetical protein
MVGRRVQNVKIVGHVGYVACEGEEGVEVNSVVVVVAGEVSSLEDEDEDDGGR